MKSWGNTLGRALRQQWKRSRRTLERYQARPVERAVHDSRVEARRLESQLELLKIFAPARLFKRARSVLEQHLDCFDTLRDTQVQLLLLRREARAVPGTEALRAALREREKDCLSRVARDLGELKTGRLKKLVNALARQFKAAGRDSGRQVRDRQAILRAVDAAHARVVARRRQMDPAHVATLHRARVAFKKLRYMVETLRPLLPEITRARVEAMHSLQTLFGELQDTDVFLAHLDNSARKEPARAAGLAPLRHWLLSRRSAQIQQCMDNGGALEEFWPPGGTPRAKKSVGKKLLRKTALRGRRPRK